MHNVANTSRWGQAFSRRGAVVKRTLLIVCISLAAIFVGCVPPDDDLDGRLFLQKKYEQIQIGSDYRAVSNQIGKGICTTGPDESCQIYVHYFRLDRKSYQEIQCNTVFTSGVTLMVSNNIIVYKAPILSDYFK